VVNQLLGALGLPRFDLYSWTGLLLVFPFYNVPLFALALMPLLESLGKELMEAARASGATPFQAWVRVLLPNLMPGILAGSAIVFAGMMGAFGTALALTGFAKNLLSLQIYSLVAESTFDLPQAAALAVVLMATTGLGLYLLALGERRWRR
jgi:putative spermidine/putrescine transport system permease protein